MTNPKPETDRERVEVQVAYLRRIGRHSLADTLERLLAGVIEQPARSEDAVRADERQLLADLLDRNRELIARYCVSAERAVGLVSLILRMGGDDVPVHSWSGRLIEDRAGEAWWEVECTCRWRYEGPQQQAVNAARLHIETTDPLTAPVDTPAARRTITGGNPGWGR